MKPHVIKNLDIQSTLPTTSRAKAFHSLLSRLIQYEGFHKGPGTGFLRRSTIVVPHNTVVTSPIATSLCCFTTGHNNIDLFKSHYPIKTILAILPAGKTANVHGQTMEESLDLPSLTIISLATRADRLRLLHNSPNLLFAALRPFTAFVQWSISLFTIISNPTLTSCMLTSLHLLGLSVLPIRRLSYGPE